MTRDDIIRMAREANFYESEIGGNEDGFVHFASLIAAAEREACAKVADAELSNTAMLLSMPPKSAAAFKVAAAIRARGQQ